MILQERRDPNHGLKVFPVFLDGLTERQLPAECQSLSLLHGESYDKINSEDYLHNFFRTEFAGRFYDEPVPSADRASGK